jgi:tetratricopeptide (TPR) repeat protein
VQGDTVALNPAEIEIDVVQFERLARRGTPEALDAAVALYHGPLLDGFRITAPAFEAWLDAERARLHDLVVDALRRVLARHVKAGRVEPATHAAARLVALDPLQEDVHRTLMRLYARQGRRAAALRQYQACVAVQQKELGVEPEPETKRLYLEILQRTVPPRGHGARAGAAAAARPAMSAADAPLIGRDAELERLRQRLRTAWRGRGHSVLVTGEPGIGKSRLVEELAAATTSQGGRVLFGRAHESEQILPFRPWMEALRTGRAIAQLAEDVTGRQQIRSDLARLFPELTGGEAPPPITADSYLRLFETIDALVADLAHVTPLVIILEDLHWADEMTLRLLSFVARRLDERPIVLLGTVREGEETPAWRRMTDELAALPHVEHLSLGALSKSATAALVRALGAGGGGDSRLTDVVAKVWALSEGNPFVIVETMRALREGRLPDAAGVELPQRVRAMIAARLERLTPRAQELARIASAFTRDFEFAVLQRAAGLGRRETAEGLEELVRRRILDAVGERFDFTHVRIRQVVYQALLAPRRQALHAAIGEAVEAVYAGRLDDMYERLAYHFSQADEPARAVAYLVHLADKVARSYALEEAARVLHEALAATACVPPPDGVRRRLDVVYRLAHVLSLLGRSAEVRELLNAHEPLVLGLREPQLTGVYHFWLAYTYSNLGDSSAAYRHAKQALEEAARSGDEVTMGKASYELARETYIMGRSREGIAHGRQAIALLERSDERWWLGQAMWALALHLLHVGDFGPGLELMERLRELGESMGERRLQAYAAWTAGRIHTVMGEAQAAIAETGRGLALAADPVARATSRGYLGAAYLEAGDAAEAIALLEESIAELQALSGTGGYRNQQIGSLLTAMLSEAYLLKGDVEHARELAARARAIVTGAGWAVALGYAERAAARVACAMGKLDDAEAAARHALETFAGSGAPAQVARSRLALAEILVAREDAAAATVELRTAREAFTQMRVPRLVERTERLAGTLGLGLDAAREL